MERELFLIIKAIKGAYKDNILYIFFIENFKKFDRLEDLLVTFLIENKNLDSSYFKVLKLKVDIEYIHNELEKHKIGKLNTQNIINISLYKNLYGEFVIFKKWYDNFFIVKELESGRYYKVLFSNKILDAININNILKLELIKNNKNYWIINKLIDVFSNTNYKIR